MARPGWDGRFRLATSPDPATVRRLEAIRRWYRRHTGQEISTSRLLAHALEAWLSCYVGKTGRVRNRARLLRELGGKEDRACES